MSVTKVNRFSGQRGCLWRKFTRCGKSSVGVDESRSLRGSTDSGLPSAEWRLVHIAAKHWLLAVPPSLPSVQCFAISALPSNMRRTAQRVVNRWVVTRVQIRVITLCISVAVE